MFGNSVNTLLVGIILLISNLAVATAQQVPADGPLTNASVVRLVKAGFKDKTVIAIIHNRPNRFNLGTEQLIQLKRDGITENIILAMLSQDETLIAGDDWTDDDSFFKDSDKKRPSDGGGVAEDQGTNIFGSSGGSNSRVRSRSGNGDSQNDGNITGSATVRIIRPLSEAGGQPLRLEKVPTLTNDEVIGLVDAGFSEGTIVKRIADSPVEFDLSAAKVDELKKRRVSDRIIAAMTAAMSDKDSETRPITPSPNPE
ncbi:MAG: hypothetical protein ABR555_05395 [Pyrinomonadaceae bacterium]